MVLAQKGAKDTDVLNHLVMHARASVRKGVRNIFPTRATLMNTAQPMDIGALGKVKGKDKGKGKKGDKGKGKEKGKQVAGST